MPKKPGKKKFKRTKFGKRAVRGAKTGTDRVKNKDGTFSSVRTAGFDIPGKRGRTDQAIAPTIRKTSTGRLVKLTDSDAARVARVTGDFVRVKARRGENVEQTRKRAARKAGKFSEKLGRISKRRDKKEAKRSRRSSKK